MSKEIIVSLLDRQINSFWNFKASEAFGFAVDNALKRVLESQAVLRETKGLFEEICEINPYHTVTWSVFLYYLSNELGKMQECEDAAKVYYLNKIMNSVDWYFEIELPAHFWAEHPLGGVLGRASYGDFFFVYQGVTVGGNEKNGILSYPVLGSRVVMYANSRLIGKCKVGNNVIFSANCYVKNEDIPDNSIVFGQSPNLVIKHMTSEEMESQIAAVWKV